MISIEEIVKKYVEYIKLFLITIGIFFVSFWIINEYILKPLQEREKSLTQKRKLIKLQQEAWELERKLNSLERKFVGKGDVSWLLQVLASFSEESKVHVESMEPLPTKNISPYKYFPVKLNISGTFPQIVRYVKLIDESEFLIFVESVKIERKTKEKSIKEGQKIILRGEMVVGFISS